MKIAISMPVGSWHPFLPQALWSLKAQGDSVAVALLDASGDSRVRELAERETDWLAYRRHGPDGGQSDAILEGWANVEGDWLGWLNADDILMPDAVAQVQAEILTVGNADLVYGHSTILDETGAMTGYHFNVEPPGPRLFQAGIISQPSCFFSRKAYDAVGGLNRDLHYVMDWDLWIRMYKSGATFRFLERPLSMVLWGEATKTASLNAARRIELQKIISDHSPGDAQGRTFRAFAVHALVDRLRPGGLRRHVQRRLRRGGQRLFGLGADGLIGMPAEIVLAHYLPDLVVGVAIETDGDASPIAVTVDPVAKRHQASSSRLEFMFDQPLPPAIICKVKLDSGTGGPAYLRRAAWITA